MKNFTFLPLVRKNLSFLSLVFAFAFAFGQNPYTITFQDETIVMPENITTFEWNQMPPNSKFNGGYYGWVQFYETPTQDVQDLFRANNLELIGYIPHRTYQFYFPESTSIDLLRNNGVRSIVPVEGRFKLSQPLRNGDIGAWAIEGNHYLVTLQHYSHVNTNFVINDLAERQIAVRQQYAGSDLIDLVIPDNCLVSLSELPYIKWIEVIAPPGVPEDENSNSLHRSSGLDTQTPSGLTYDGEGVGILVRDQGPIFEHVDFTGRLENIPPYSSGTHGINVAGAFAGAGNIRPDARGSAAGATIKATAYNSSFLDPVTVGLINDGTVQVTNSSYSDNCNGGYNSRAVTVDTQLFTLPTVEHVFSAGNSNGSNCGYGAGSQWGNITGGHKSAKNCITVGATTLNGNIASFSSRGPATDGRIKPDISGHGVSVLTTNPGNGYTAPSGTSFSAPAVAGVVTQLYQVYMDANSGNLPPAALIKAALLNCATDFGNAGPDFIFGWGIANGLRAGKLIEDGRYLSSTISQGNTNVHTINVPAGTAQVRFMVYWNDQPATAGANPALVNDLDLVVTDPSSGTHLPFLLDHTPNATNLNTPAGNGVDHLNNMEQVLLDSPASGNYDIEITGFNVPVGPQEYFVVYEIIENNITVTHPNGGEKLVHNLNTVIHWDAVGTTDPFTLEYSDDNGASWNAITTIGATFRNFTWPVGSTGITGDGDMLVRVTSGAHSDVSDDNFSIAVRPTGLAVTEVCETTATFEWNAVADAESYDLYLLGDMYMEVVASSNTNSITIPIADPNDSFWYSVAARNDTDGWEGRRSNAISYSGGLLNCVILGLDDFQLSGISLYPNPATNEVFVSLENANFTDFNITVSNSLGQTLQILDDRSLNGDTQAAINVSGYSTGLYFVTIQIDGQSTTKKLVVR